MQRWILIRSAIPLFWFVCWAIRINLGPEPLFAPGLSRSVLAWVGAIVDLSHTSADTIALPVEFGIPKGARR